MNIKILFIAFLSILTIRLAAQEQKMSATEITNFKTAMTKATKVKTLEADFTQFKKVGYVKKEVTSSGKFYIRNPDQLAWIYTNPVKYTMIFKDRKIWISDQGKTKKIDLSRSKQFEKISQAIQANVSGRTYSGSDFTSSYYKNAKSYILKLDPVEKDVKKAMKQLVITLDKVNYQITEINIIEPSLNYTRFVLRNQKVNTALADTVFEL